MSAHRVRCLHHDECRTDTDPQNADSYGEWLCGAHFAKYGQWESDDTEDLA